jgi:hypothetical protein
LSAPFRYNDDVRLAEDWVQTDYCSFLSKLDVTTTEIAPTGDARPDRPYPVTLGQVTRGAGQPPVLLLSEEAVSRALWSVLRQQPSPRRWR